MKKEALICVESTLARGNIRDHGDERAQIKDKMDYEVKRMPRVLILAG